MKFNKIFPVILALAVLLMPCVGYAGTTNLDDLVVNTFTTGTSAVTTSTSSGQTLFQTSLVAEGRVGASTQVHSSSTNLAPSSMPYAIIMKNIGAAGGPDSSGVGTHLENGVAGQVLSFVISDADSAGGDTWIVTPKTATGFSSITFAIAGQFATLLYVNDTVGWIVTSIGASASTASPTVALVTFVGHTG